MYGRWKNEVRRRRRAARIRPSLEVLEVRALLAALEGFSLTNTLDRSEELATRANSCAACGPVSDVSRLAASFNDLIAGIGLPIVPQHSLSFTSQSLRGASMLGSPRDIAVGVLTQHAADLGLTAADLADVTVTNQFASQRPGTKPLTPRQRSLDQGVDFIDQATPQSTGVTHLYLRQRYNGLDIVNAPLNVNLTSQGEVINAYSSFVSLPAGVPPAIHPVLSAAEALTAAAPAFDLTLTAAPRVVSASAGPAQETLLDAPELSTDPIPAKLDYVADHSGELRLVWSVVLSTPDGQHWYDAQLDSTTGRVVQVADWVESATYNAVPITFQDPFEAPRSLLIDPNDPSASPFGWHDTDGVPGVEFTDTRGNNVFAQEDADANNAGGFRPDGGASLNFDFPFDDTQDPSTYRSASIANLFYAINAVHDIFWHYGFDEAAGNFQMTNYSGHGAGGDPVIADAQDGSGTDNANFRTPPDGQQPRMQMYLWNAAEHSSIRSNTPGLASPTGVGTADFGPQNFDLTADLILADPPLADGPLTNNVAGKIVLIERGTVPFVEKVQRAQAAGAVGVIIANNQPGRPPSLGGDDSAISIPALSVSQDYGQTLSEALTAGPVSLTMQRQQVPPRDAAFDNGIIIHEFGHGVSNRLTGGPANASALRNLQSKGMGEGWSDWFELMLTQRSSDTADDPRVTGAYVTGNPAGIRRHPYSFDMNVNPITFDDYEGSTEEHDVGEIWASALWDMTWLLIDKYGYDAELSTGFTGVGTGAAGNKLALQLVLDAMKLQPANPSFIQARDALLLADTLLMGSADHDAIWTAFARRGLGLSAQTSDSSSRSVDAAFDLPPPLPQVTTPRAAGAPGEALALAFSRAIGPSFSLADLKSFTGPNGADQRAQITGFHFDLTRQHLQLDLAPSAPTGAYTLVLSANIRDFQGGLLDQDKDGVGGEMPQDEATVIVLVMSPDAGFQVTTTADEDDQTFVPSDLSLREAVAWANLRPGADVVTFANSTNGTPFVLTLGQVKISDSLAIVGNAATPTVIDSRQKSRIFDVDMAAGDVRLERLALTKGKTTANGDEGKGAAVRFLSPGTLTLNQSTLSGNSTTGEFAWGGAVYSRSGPVSVNDSTLSNNFTTGKNSLGGAIASRSGALSLSRSTLSGNSTAGDFSSGGALYSTFGAVSVNRSTLAGNSTSGGGASGGAIANGSGPLTVTQSTLSGNATRGFRASFLNASGGAIFHGPVGAVTVMQSTITGNVATNSSGGGIYAQACPLTITNSIVAGNRDDGTAPDFTARSLFVAYPLIVQFSLIGTNVGTRLAASANPDQNGNVIGTELSPINPRLAPLANNGGPTRTHALLSGSPALNRGDNGLIPGGATADQRGTPFLRVVNLAVDMGAFEQQTILNGPAVQYDSGAKTLVVRGTTGSDNLEVTRGTDGVIRVVAGTYRFGPYPDSSVDTLYVYGLQGNDRISIGSVNADVFVYGDAGNDSIQSGNLGKAILHGGAGNDLLSGNQNGSNLLTGDDGDDILIGGLSARNVLIGGRGRDQLTGGFGNENLLIGGMTAHDGNDLALLGILAEWSDPRPIETRVRNLTVGGGLNASYLLVLRTTVFDDLDKDTLRGGLMRDWVLRSVLDDWKSGLTLPDIINS